MTEKKKIVVWGIVAVFLIMLILILLFDEDEEVTDTKEVAETIGVETQLQEEIMTVNEEETKPTPEPTSEPTQGIVELPFVPVN